MYPELVPKFDPEKVVFVFLANSSIKGIWEKKVSELKFKGDHYFLNGGQSAVMSEIFGVSALPHHAIIDAEGNIVEKRMTSISSEIISKYLQH
ncbi:MAG: TlpA family protein disulfide reductase [Saprospiraceae bacterium]